MEDTVVFGKYILKRLYESGLAIDTSPLYLNHKIKQFMYEDASVSGIVPLTIDERSVLTMIDNISHLIEIDATAFENKDSDEGISIYSLELSVNDCGESKSECVCRAHAIIQKHIETKYSLVFVRCEDKYVVSMAEGRGFVILSDWFDKYSDDEIWNKLDICGLSIDSAEEFYEDLVYALERKYYKYFYRVGYGVYQVVNHREDTAITKKGQEIIGRQIAEIIETFGSEYGDDFVAPYPVVSTEEKLDELELFGLENKQEEESPRVLENSKDEKDIVDIPEDVLVDPIKLTKWLEEFGDF